MRLPTHFTTQQLWLRNSFKKQISIGVSSASDTMRLSDVYATSLCQGFLYYNSNGSAVLAMGNISYLLRIYFKPVTWITLLPILSSLSGFLGRQGQILKYHVENFNFMSLRLLRLNGDCDWLLISFEILLIW